MTDRAAESYQDWLERTTPAPNRRISWHSWIALAVGLLLIFGMNVVLIGCLVLGSAVAEPVTVFRRTTPERTRRRLSILWTGVWTLGSIVVLVREDDRDGFWWALLVLTGIMLLAEVIRQVRRKTPVRTPGSPSG